ncbi:hypothetical protein DXG01_001861 [Tephrocybe rancida]|nr:hypothetical protein DXG01_001861 [Tephrocybe rancida]
MLERDTSEGDNVPDNASTEMEQELQDSKVSTLLALLQQEMLGNEIAWLQSTVEDLSPRSDIMDAMDAAYNSITHCPIGMKTASNIQILWSEILRLAPGKAHTSVTHCRERAHIMVSTYTIWHWLDFHIATRCEAIIRGSTTGIEDGEDSSWLLKLMMAVWEIFELKQGSAEFNPRKFDLNLKGSTMIFHNTFQNTDMSEQPRHATEAVLQILQAWLGFSQDESRYRSWFVGCVILKFGPNALLLEVVWSDFVGIKRISMQPTGQHGPTDRLWPVLEKLWCHPLSKPSSRKAHILDQIGSLVLSMSQRGRMILSQKSDNVTGQPSHTSLQGLIDEALEVHHCKPKSPTKWQVASMADPNRLCPFREFIPSRNLFHGEDGPFSHQHARSDIGAPSTLTWRGVTFGTTFSEVETKIFPTMQHWDQALKCHSEEPTNFFCNQQAYGQHCNGRGVGLVSEYTEALATHSWAKFVQGQMVPFMECYDWFTATDKHSKKVVFKQIGSLTAYLLTCNYVYASVVQAPSDEELGKLLAHIHKGAVAGLQYLGFLPRGEKFKGQSGAGEVAEAFAWAVKSISNMFTEDQREKVMFDNIMAENLLCKFARMINRHLIAL